MTSLQTRIKSALILAVAALALLWAGGAAFALAMAAVAGIGAYEWARMTVPGEDAPHRARFAGLLAGVGAFTALPFGGPLPSLWVLAALGFLVFAVYAAAGKGKEARLLWAGFVYIGFACAVMIWLRGERSDQGLYYLALLLAIVWASDICAYFTGKTLGGPKLAPRISPKKTWSGFFGSSLGAALAAAAFALPAFTDFLDVDRLPGFNTYAYAALGFFLAMAGQGGDLLVSVFKRKFGVKDTGSLIPGHGGVLDRIDALMLVAILYGAIVGIFA